MLVEPFDIEEEDTYEYIQNKHYEDAFSNESINNNSKLVTINKYSSALTDEKHKCGDNCNYKK